MRTILIIMLMLVVPSAMAGSLYRWVDSAGNVHYGDVPPNDAQQLQEKNFYSPASGASGEGSMSFETRRAMKHFPVTLYVQDGCKAPCQQARDFLNQRHIPFTEKRLETKQEISDFKKRSGSQTVPTLSVGSDWLKGFLAEDWQNELDATGYPKQP